MIANLFSLLPAPLKMKIFVTMQKFALISKLILDILLLLLILFRKIMKLSIWLVVYIPFAEQIVAM